MAARPGNGPETKPGSGLRGMSERLTALGGRLSLGETKAGAGRGLRLVATVPAPAPTPDAGGLGRRTPAREEPGLRQGTAPSASVPARPD